jgi:hypothetical protein
LQTDANRPAGTNENSPQFQLRDNEANGKAPQGRQKFLSSLRDFISSIFLPAVETAGYFRASLRDFMSVNFENKLQ